MKLHEILPSIEGYTVEEGFIPADTILILSMLADGRSTNINHRFVLANMVQYLSQHPLTAERYRENNVMTVSDREWLDECRNMPVAKLATLAKHTMECIEHATRRIQDAQYTNPQVELLNFLNSPKQQD